MSNVRRLTTLQTITVSERFWSFEDRLQSKKFLKHDRENLINPLLLRYDFKVPTH